MPLGQHSAQPGREAAPAMEIPEQRLARLVATRHAVQIGIERVGELACTASRVDRIGAAIQHGSMFADEVLPGFILSGGAAARERQVLEMERFEESLELRTNRVACSRMPCSRSHRARRRTFREERPTGHRPSAERGAERGCRRSETIASVNYAEKTSPPETLTARHAHPVCGNDGFCALTAQRKGLQPWRVNQGNPHNLAASRALAPEAHRKPIWYRACLLN